MYNCHKQQSGAVLIISLVMLLLLTIIGISGTQTSSLEEKMAGNMRDKNLAFQAAESALIVAEHSLDPPAVPPDGDDVGTGGFYSGTSTIPTNSALLTDLFWSTQNVAVSTVTGLGNNIEKPLYIIQNLGPTYCEDDTPGTLNCRSFRITVRATGGTSNSVVILQSTYIRA